MFCRYCGTPIAADSIFCPRCGKRLHSGNPKVEKLIAKFRLKTPYPYFLMLLIGFITWAAWPKGTPSAYTDIKWSLEKDKDLDSPDEDLYQQSLSLVLENKGQKPVRDIRVDLVATITPQKKADIVAGFIGRRLEIMQAGESLPLTVILGDPIDPGQKRRYLLEGAITAKPPFKVTYQVRQEGRANVLAAFSVEK